MDKQNFKVICEIPGGWRVVFYQGAYTVYAVAGDVNGRFLRPRITPLGSDMPTFSNWAQL